MCAKERGRARDRRLSCFACRSRFSLNDFQAVRKQLCGTAAIAWGLVWHILHPPLDDDGQRLFLRRAGALQVNQEYP